MRKNVLQFLGSFHQGGSERQAVQLTRLLAESGRVNVHLATLNNEGHLKGEAESLRLPEITEFKLTSFYDLNFLRQLRRCARFLREREIDVVHTHDFYTNIFGIAAARLAGVPAKIASKRETGGMRGRTQKLMEKQAFRLAEAVVVNAEAVKKYLAGEGVPAEKINVVHNGLDLARLEPEIRDRRRVCEMLGLPAGDGIKFVTLVANLRHEVKNQPMFLRAARQVAEKFPEARFVIAGEGELKGGLENMARELGIAGKTYFTGRCERVAELLFVSYACVLSSRAEGFSNSILEYMAAAKPVVATDVGGAREAVKDSENGFLVPSDDDAAMARKLAELLGNEEKAASFGAAGRRIAEERFSLSAQLERTLELYGRVC